MVHWCRPGPPPGLTCLRQPPRFPLLRHWEAPLLPGPALSVPPLRVCLLSVLPSSYRYHVHFTEVQSEAACPGLTQLGLGRGSEGAQHTLTYCLGAVLRPPQAAAWSLIHVLAAGRALMDKELAKAVILGRAGRAGTGSVCPEKGSFYIYKLGGQHRGTGGQTTTHNATSIPHGVSPGCSASDPAPC